MRGEMSWGPAELTAAATPGIPQNKKAKLGPDAADFHVDLRRSM